MDKPKTEVYYEWVVEQVDEHGDIQDTYAVDSFIEAYKEEKTYSVKCIALRRDKGNEEDGLQDRGYAYVTDGILEENFCSGHKVPKKYFTQVQQGLRDAVYENIY